MGVLLATFTEWMDCLFPDHPPLATDVSRRDSLRNLCPVHGVLSDDNRTTIDGRCLIPMVSASELARRRVPGSVPWLHENLVNARRCILYA